MSKKRAVPRADAGQPPQAIPEVMVVTITYAPAQNQIIGIDPHYPRQMSADDVIHILRSAERTIIETITAQKLAQTTTND